MTLSAAASPPDVHQCSICTSLTSAAGAALTKPIAAAAVTPTINMVRSFIVCLPVRLSRRMRSGPVARSVSTLPNSVPSPVPREPPARARPVMDVERLFLSVVFDGIMSKLAAGRRSPSPGRAGSGPAPHSACLRRRRLRLWRSWKTSPTGRRSCGARLARNAATPSARSSVVAVKRAGQSLDRSVAVLALGEIDHRLDDLHRHGAARGDVRGQLLSAPELPRLSRSPRRPARARAPPRR